MPRLRHATSGVVVNVDDATAARLGAGWEPADAPDSTEKPKATRRRTAAKSDDKK